MRVRSRVVVLLAWAGVLAACASGGVDQAASASTSTSVMSPTTSPTASTVEQSVPTTSLATTTTTLAPTTTFTLLEGNWAAQPVITTSGWEGVLGWWDGSTWVEVDADTDLPVVGGEDYQVALLGDSGVTTGSAPVLRCEFTDPHPGVTLSGVDRLVRFDGPGVIHGVGISAAWNLTPHLVEEIADDGTYSAFASDVLADLGYQIAEPVIRQLVRFDAEGDGVHEVLVVAEDAFVHSLEGTSGVYSVVFLRRLFDSEVVTTVIGESVIPPEDVGFPVAFRVGAVADLSGDGIMEVVVSASGYEASWMSVLEITSQGAEIRLSAGCGV